MKRPLTEQFNLSGHSEFLSGVSVTLIDKQALKIPLNETSTGFI